MHSQLRASARMLFRWAMGIFLVTIVIGVLNGLDLWSPSRELLLTHVHAGTLGWITMAVVGVAILMFGDGADEKGAKTGAMMAKTVMWTTVLYVVTFATTTGILRPIAGTLMLIAIVLALVWVAGRYRASEKTVPGLAMYLAMVSLAIGAVLGVLLGLFIANGSLPGLDNDTAGSLAGAHPPAMLVGYLMLAGAAVAEFFLNDRAVRTSESKLGVSVAWILFLAGLLFNVAFIADVEPLIQVATLLELAGIVIFVVRMRSHLAPSAWSGGGTRIYGRMSVLWLAIGMAIFVYLVQLFISGQIDPEAGEGLGILVAFDHAMFVGVMTNALLMAFASTMAFDGVQKAIVWGTNVGLVGFLIGLVAESAAVKRVSTAVLGAALLLAAWTFMMNKESASAA